MKNEDEVFQLPLSSHSFEPYKTEAPAPFLETSKKEMKELYADMWRIR